MKMHEYEALSYDDREGKKICDMKGVIEYTGDGHYQIELVKYTGTNTLVIRSYNECGNNHVDIDFDSIVEWIKLNPRPPLE